LATALVVDEDLERLAISQELNWRIDDVLQIILKSTPILINEEVSHMTHCYIARRKNGFNGWTLREA
jgi:hypothetical protein